MRAITLTQPWATLVVLGLKQYETRSWRPKYATCGDLAIHAAKEFPQEARSRCYQEPFVTALARGGYTKPSDLPRGAIVGVAWLTGIQRVSDLDLNMMSETEIAFGDYAPGRFAWRLIGAVRCAEPVPARGSLGIWDVPIDIAAKLPAPSVP